jgi:hypothetical protein
VDRRSHRETPSPPSQLNELAAPPASLEVGTEGLLHLVEQANPTGDLAVITDNLSSHSSYSTRTWLADHRRIRQVFIPKAACWLNLQEG